MPEIGNMAGGRQRLLLACLFGRQLRPQLRDLGLLHRVDALLLNLGTHQRLVSRQTFGVLAIEVQIGADRGALNPGSRRIAPVASALGAGYTSDRAKQ